MLIDNLAVGSFGEQPRDKIDVHAAFAGKIGQHGRVADIDGAHHQGGANPITDALRQNAVALHGDRVLCIPDIGLRSDPDAFLDQIEAALIDAGVVEVRALRRANLHNPWPSGQAAAASASRSARLTADRIAMSDARTVDSWMPTPRSTRSPMARSRSASRAR